MSKLNRRVDQHRQRAELSVVRSRDQFSQARTMASEVASRPTLASVRCNQRLSESGLGLTEVSGESLGCCIIGHPGSRGRLPPYRRSADRFLTYGGFGSHRGEVRPGARSQRSRGDPGIAPSIGKREVRIVEAFITS